MNYKILIVDDEAANLRMLERLFRNQYTVITAQSGGEALELLKQHDVALIISDQRMPAMTGIEFLKRAAEMRPPTVRIILTGYTDINALIEGINSGFVYKYVTKPWVNEDLQQTVKRGLQHYETIKSQHELSLQNARLQARLKTTLGGFIGVIVEMLNLKDSHTHGHSYRTRNYAAAIGRQLNLESDELEQLTLAAFLHEAAHVNIPDHLLHKTTSLTEDERRTLVDNFERGLQMLANVPDLEDIVSTIRYHHENYDGSGFPYGFDGEQIPLHSRIIAVADSYDELTTPPDSKPALTHKEAIERLQSGAGVKFDPEVVKVFCELNSINQVS